MWSLSRSKTGSRAVEHRHGGGREPQVTSYVRRVTGAVGPVGRFPFPIPVSRFPSSPGQFPLPSRAGVRPYTSTYVFAEPCVFVKQSVPPGFCALYLLGPRGISQLQRYLLPKLQYQFAEFLNKTSLKHLSILYYPTCVGLRYECIVNSCREFSGKHGLYDFRSLTAPPHHLSG